jgi:hypothetical protein
MISLDQLGIIVRASTAAHVIGADVLSRALNEFEPSDKLETYLDCAELAWSCRNLEKLPSLRFRPWAREAFSQAAALFEGAGMAIEIAGALHAVARPVSPLATEVSDAVA